MTNALVSVAQAEIKSLTDAWRAECDRHAHTRAQLAACCAARDELRRQVAALALLIAQHDAETKDEATEPHA